MIIAYNNKTDSSYFPKGFVMEPQVKTGMDWKSFAWGFGAATVAGIATSIIVGRKDHILTIGGAPHLLFRPLTPSGEELLKNITVRVNGDTDTTPKS